MRVERIVLGLHRTALARVRPPGEALGDEPAGTGLDRAGEQVVRAVGPKPVGEHELAVELPRIAAQTGQRGELMDHDLGRGVPNGAYDGVTIERVAHNRLGAGPLDRVRFLRRARQRGD